jgi:TIR domain-containing protein
MSLRFQRRVHSGRIRFLSHNRADREVARSIGAHRVLTGIDVWFDEWEIQAGDSIPGKLNEGLAAFDAFVPVLSAKPTGRTGFGMNSRSCVQSGTVRWRSSRACSTKLHSPRISTKELEMSWSPTLVRTTHRVLELCIRAATRSHEFEKARV